MAASATGFQPLPHDAPVHLRTWVAVAAALLGAFMAVLDIQITNASLKEILGTLGATQAEGSWISSSYLVAEVVVIPIAGFLAVVFGTRAYLMVNVLLFLLFSTLCGLAWNLESMIVFRALQGFTGGVMIPMAMTLVMTLLPKPKQPIGLALFGITATLAPTLGPTVGGWLTEVYAWPVVFYINWLPGLLLLAGVGWGLAPQPRQLDLLRRVDWIGIGVMALGLGSLTAMLEEGNAKDWFESDFIRVTALLAAVGLAAWTWRGLTRRDSAVDLRLMKRPSFLIASVVSFTTGIGLYGSAFLLPLYLGQIAGYTPMQIGEVIMWMGLPQLLIMPFVAKLAVRYDNRVLATVGLSLFALSCFMNTGLSAQTAGPELIASQVVRALGQPLIMMTLTNFATVGIPMTQMGSASGLFSMMRNLGGSVGIATLATLVTNREHFHSNRLGEAVSLYEPAVVERLDRLTQQMQTQGLDPAAAADAALKLLDASVRRESFVMGYNDAFLVLGIALLACVAFVWMGRRVVGGGGAAEAH
jgi:DHA2 family multidrug resistance protein